MKKSAVAIAVGAVAIGLGITYLQRATMERATTHKVRLPSVLSADAQQGKGLFDAKCRDCHGANAAGTDQGPPLVHKYYEPGHHADRSFYRAVRYGVRAHHWPFGDMQPVPGVTAKQVASIVRYVRELQKANGIE